MPKAKPKRVVEVEALKPKLLDVCPFHCPRWISWLFLLVALWYFLSAFGIGTLGSFWAWVVFITGLCMWVCCGSEQHRATGCYAANLPTWLGVLTTFVGVWFILGTAGFLPLFGINLLYLAALLVAIGWICLKC